jgi:hypothetical protein
MLLDRLEEDDKVEMAEEERQREIARLTEIIERPKKANILSRDVYKWFLEFVRNCMVVAALFYLARRSGDWWVYGIAGVSAFALAGYCYTYVDAAWLEFKISHEGWRKHLTIILGALLVQLVFAGITVGLCVTLDRIVTIQIGMTKAP